MNEDGQLFCEVFVNGDISSRDDLQGILTGWLGGKTDLSTIICDLIEVDVRNNPRLKHDEVRARIIKNDSRDQEEAGE